MKVRLNKTAWRLASGVVASSALVFLFQNCGKAGFDAQLDSSTDYGLTDAELVAKYGEATAAKVQGIPFALDSSFDTITYNSCADSQLANNSAFFSLKAGAYSTGGVKLNTEFFDYADQNFSPVYPETSLTENQYKEYLADSPINNGAVPTMALRVKNSLTDVYVQNGAGTSVTLNKDVIPLVGNLTDSLLMDSYATKGITAHYFPFSPEQRILEGALNFNSEESLADDFRNVLMSSGVLALTYLPNNSEANAVRSPSGGETSVKSAYGKGYSLTFAPFPVSGAAATNPNHVLSQVVETDLANPGVGGRTWSCNHVYAVVRAQDAATLCPPQSYSDIQNNSNYRAELDLMRRHLRADQWDINVVNGCVVPKGSVSCYKEESIENAALVEYDLTKECFRPNGSYFGATPSSKCMHFVTVCTRN